METAQSATKDQRAREIERGAARLAQAGGRVRKHRTIETPLSGLTTAIYKTLVAVVHAIPAAPKGDEPRGK